MPAPGTAGVDPSPRAAARPAPRPRPLVPVLLPAVATALVATGALGLAIHLGLTAPVVAVAPAVVGGAHPGPASGR